MKTVLQKLYCSLRSLMFFFHERSSLEGKRKSVAGSFLFWVVVGRDTGPLRVSPWETALLSSQLCSRMEKELKWIVGKEAHCFKASYLDFHGSVSTEINKIRTRNISIFELLS